MRVDLTGPELAAIKPRDLNPDGSLLSVSQWASKYRIVTTGSRSGPWRNEITPYLVEPMDMLTKPGIRSVALMFAPQTGKTQVAFNFLCWAIDQEPDWAMYVMPDESTAKRLSKGRVLPMLKESPRIAAHLSDSAHDTTTFSVSFRHGMQLILAWSTSAAQLASDAVRYLIFDETDKYPAFAGREADPIALGEMRATTYGDEARVLYLSTPTTEAGTISRIMTKRMDEVREYVAICPKCGSAQRMDFGGIRWPEKVRDPREIARRKLARYACAHCDARWTDHQRDLAVSAGYWETETPIEGARNIGYHLPSWYSPFVSLSRVAEDFLMAEEVKSYDREEYLSRRMVFVTQHEARGWRERARRSSADELAAYLVPVNQRGTAPAGTYCLTMAVDMQKDHFFFTVRAWGPWGDEETWRSRTIDYGRLETWDDIRTMLISTVWPVEGGDSLGIWRAALDTGGGEGEGMLTKTEEAYSFLHSMSSRIMGVKGASHNQEKAIVPSKRPDTAPQRPGGAMKMPRPRIFILKTWYFKDLLFERLEIGEHDFGDCGQDFLEQIAAEEKVLHRGAYRWKQIGARPNHYFDCEMMHEAMGSEAWIPHVRKLRGPQQGMGQPVQVVKRRPPTENPYTHGRQLFGRG